MKFARILLVSLLAVGCTVTPRTVKDAGASFNGNERNSGLIGFLPDGSALITPTAKARYDFLAIKYGKRFYPPLAEGFGTKKTSTNTYIITAEALVDFGVMSNLQRLEIKPK